MTKSLKTFKINIMKKITILLIMISVAFSYSCEKNEKVKTNIRGRLLTNGTNDPIRISQEIEKPRVALFHNSGGGFQSGGSWDEINVVTVDANANYSMEVEIFEKDEYYLGFYNLDGTYYYDNSSSARSWYYVNFYPVTPGNFNNIDLYCLAKSWVIPRFINTNTDPDNVDVFDIGCGIGGPEAGVLLNDLIGSNDTTMSWIHSTWSGTYKYGVHKPEKAHKVEGKLTRNGVTKDIEIIYNVPPFDTTVVEIEY